MSAADIVIICIVAVCVIAGIVRGFVKTLAGLISLAAAFLLAMAAASPLSAFLYDRFLGDRLGSMLGMPSQSQSVPAPGYARTLQAGLPRLPARSAAVAALSQLGDLKVLIEDLPGDYIDSLDPEEMQRFVNFLCSPVCKNKTLSSCVRAYNKRYGTDVDIGPVLDEYGVSAQTKVPELLCVSGLKFNVKGPIKSIQNDRAEAAAQAKTKPVTEPPATKPSAGPHTAKPTTEPPATKPAAEPHVTEPTAEPHVTEPSAPPRPASSEKTAASEHSTTKPHKPSETAGPAPSVPPTSSVPPAESADDGLAQDFIASAQSAIRGLAVKMVGSVVFVLLFVLIRLLLQALAGLLTSLIKKIPVARGINRVLGGALGALSGIIISLAAVAAFTSVSPLITDQRYVDAVENSVICSKAKEYIFSGQDSAFQDSEFDFSEDDFDFDESDS